MYRYIAGVMSMQDFCFQAFLFSVCFKVWLPSNSNTEKIGSCPSRRQEAFSQLNQLSKSRPEVVLVEVEGGKTNSADLGSVTYPS